ncbi:MAG: ABC transporter ATP-binding protein [Desulfurococcales archaeon]|nr:ABC transporter ATP-binding protein [Desulfurococcales archaeon]
MVDELLRVEDLKVYFPIYRSLVERILGRPYKVVRAVDGVSLKLGRREVLALVGESGSGKTTLGRAILGLVKPTSGRIVFDGLDVTKARGGELRRIRRRMSIVFQDPYKSLDPLMPVGEQVAEPLLVHGVAGKEEARRRAFEMLERVGLTPAREFYWRKPYQLSGGQRQRVAVARALISEPDLIVADEPVSMIDVSLRASILELLASARREMDSSIILITHDIATARLVADRVAVMYLGKIVEEGPVDEVIESPRHPYTAALLTAAPSISKRRPPRFPVKGEIGDPASPPTGCRFHPRCPLATRECSIREPGYSEVGGRRYACIHPLEPGSLWRGVEVK